MDADSVDGLGPNAFTARPDEMCAAALFMTGWEQDGDAVCAADTAGTGDAGVATGNYPDPDIDQDAVGSNELADNSVGQVSAGEPDEIANGTVGCVTT